MSAHVLLLLVACSSPSHLAAQPPPDFGETRPPARVKAGLIALYEFAEGKGNQVRDTAGNGKPLPLTFSSKGAGTWLPDGGLSTSAGKTALWTEGAATKITQAIKATNQFTVEVRITNGDIHQTGPARIVSLSKDTAVRNFTLGLDQGHFALRVRTTKTDAQGMPELTTGTKTALSMPQDVAVVFGGGLARLYVNGQAHIATKHPGALSNWDPSFRLVVGNEATLDRPWQGRIELLAIYNRALSAAEIARNVKALEAAK